MHQKAFEGRECSPDPIAAIWGLLLRGGEERKGEGCGGKKGIKGRGRERMHRGGRGGRMGEDRRRGRGEVGRGKWRGEKEEKYQIQHCLLLI